MEPDTLTKLLRIFYKHSVEYIIYIIQGKITGIINKQDVVNMMSDLSIVSDIDQDIPVTKINDLEEVLDIHHKYGIIQDSNKVIPVVNAKNEFVGTWGRAEIIQAYENIAEVKTWKPPSVSVSSINKNPLESETLLEKRTMIHDDSINNIEDDKSSIGEYNELDFSLLNKLNKNNQDALLENNFRNIKKNSVHSNTVQNDKELSFSTRVKETVENKNTTSRKSRIKLQVRKSTEMKQNRIDVKKRPLAEVQRKEEIFVSRKKTETRIKEQKVSENKSIGKAKWKVEVERGRLAVLTLETLPLPMVAIDTAGSVIFYNKDWEDDYASRVDNEFLLDEAKSLMAKKALAGSLEVKKTLDLPNILPKKLVRMKAMRSEVLNDNNVPVMRTIGYLFWIDDSKVALIDSHSREEITTFSEDKQYLGSTLPDILAEEEKKAISWAMNESDNNITNAAMLLGIPRQTLSYKYHKLFD